MKLGINLKYHQTAYILDFTSTNFHEENLTLLHSKRPKLYGVLAVLSAIGLNSFNDMEQNGEQLLVGDMLSQPHIHVCQKLTVCLSKSVARSVCSPHAISQRTWVGIPVGPPFINFLPCDIWWQLRVNGYIQGHQKCMPCLFLCVSEQVLIN